jgi:hypothetical protein
MVEIIAVAVVVVSLSIGGIALRYMGARNCSRLRCGKPDGASSDCGSCARNGAPHDSSYS